MQLTVPLIYNRGASRSPSLGMLGRLLAAGIAMSGLAIFVMALRIEPNPKGVGSHRALGLNECQFLQTTGLPCPSCGMTTSFCWFVRGNIVASLYIQPMATVLAILIGGCIWGALYIAATGRPVYRLLRVIPTTYYLMAFFTVGVMAWGWKIWIHLNGMDGWGG